MLRAMFNDLVEATSPELPDHAVVLMEDAVHAGMLEVAKSDLPDDAWIAGVREYAPARGDLPEVVRFRWVSMLDSAAVEEIRYEITDYLKVEHCRSQGAVG